MATVTILSGDEPYYNIRVSFCGLDFDQNIVTTQKGAALKKQLQAYADAYEAAYVGPSVADSAAADTQV
jgi:hypothetical protein